MKKLSKLAIAMALAFAGHAALADDSSMNRWNGDSYIAFEAAKSRDSVALAPAWSRKLSRVDDNSMSRWNGDSYAAFEQARTSSPAVTISIAEANKARAAANREVPARSTTRGRVTVNPFRDDTAA